MVMETTGKYRMDGTLIPPGQTTEMQVGPSMITGGVSMITGRPLDLDTSRFDNTPRADRSTRDILEGLAHQPKTRIT